MNYKQFLEESKKANIKIHAFDKKPSFEKIKALPKGDLFVLPNDDDLFRYEDKKLLVYIFPATKNEDFFKNYDENYILVEIDPELETDVGETPTDFNPNNNHVSTKEFQFVTGIDLKESKYKISYEVYRDKKEMDDEELAEVGAFEELAKSLNKENIAKILVSIQKEIDDYAEKYIEL